MKAGERPGVRSRKSRTPGGQSGDETKLAGGTSVPRGTLLAGAILAGGDSRRMGRDKALLTIRREPLWRRHARELRSAGAMPVFVIRRQGQHDVGKGVRHVWDEFTGAGPMAGLHAALKAARAVDARWVAVVAVDMPQIDAVWYCWLWELCRPGGGAVARHADGFEPLAAIYPTSALLAVRRRLRSEKLSLQELVDALVRAGKMAVMKLPEAERWRVKNWNRPEDR